MAYIKVVKPFVVLSYSIITLLLVASSVEARHAFTVDVNHRGEGLLGPASYRATLLKHGKYIPPELDQAAKDPSILINEYRKACTPAELAELDRYSDSTVPSLASRDNHGSTTAFPAGDDNGFYAALTVGQSKLDFLIDTGSSDLWAYSDRLPKNEIEGHHLYNTSTGTRLKGSTWKIIYGDKTGAAGIVYRDTVKIGKATATSQAVEAATSISKASPAGRHGDGILGLGFESLNTIKPKKQPPLWQNLANIKKTFAVDFNYRSNGTIKFGDINTSKRGPITYVPVAPASYWFFNWTAYEIFGKTRPLHLYPHGHPANGILDTGTSFLVISGPAAAAYYKHIKGAKRVYYHWLFPCNAKVGDFGFKFGNQTFYVYKEYMKQPVGYGVCSGAIQGAAGYGSKYDSGAIIGDPFIVGNYIIFDGERRRLGFAHKHLDLKSHTD